jgi:hypothetical protein
MFAVRFCCMAFTLVILQSGVHKLLILGCYNCCSSRNVPQCRFQGSRYPAVKFFDGGNDSLPTHNECIFRRMGFHTLDHAACSHVPH